MNKGEIVGRMAQAAGITKNAADKALNEFMNSIAGAVKDGERVTLIGFGTFFVNERKARTGRNPRTGKTINIAAKKTVKFKPGTKLTESVG